MIIETEEKKRYSCSQALDYDMGKDLRETLDSASRVGGAMPLIISQYCLHSPHNDVFPTAVMHALVGRAPHVRWCRRHIRVVMEISSRHQTDGTRTNDVHCLFVDSADPL